MQSRIISTVLFWQFVVPAAQSVYDDEATYLRRANLTTSVTNYNQCDIKCVSSVETGHQSGCLGYAGDDCSFPYEICPDSKTQCFGEYAVCVDISDTSNDRQYKCECRAPSTNEPYAEMMQDSRIEDCRSRATEICEKDQTASSYAFCTNGGQCVAEVEEGEPHPGCFCPGRFVGRHCEKRRGTGREYRVEPPIQVDESNELPNQQNGNNNNNKIENRRIGTSVGVFVVVGSSALSAFLLYSIVAYKRFLAQREAPPLEDGSGKTDLSIHVPPGGNDNVSALEMH